MRFLVTFIYLLSLSAISAFCPSPKLSKLSSLPVPFSQQWLTNDVNGAGAGAGAVGNSDVSSTTTGGLVTASDAKSQLFSAFTALDLPDQYDAVLTGLCAKILDNEQRTTSSASSTDPVPTGTAKALQDPMQLLQEMNQKRIVASPRSIMALIDVRSLLQQLCVAYREWSTTYLIPDLFVSILTSFCFSTFLYYYTQSTVKAQDAELMAQVLSLCLKNGGIQSFGSLQADILLLPSAPTSQIKCPDGSRKTRTERLASVADIPSDNRAKEVSSALAVAAVAAGCTLTDVMHADDITLYANTILSALLAVGLVDNFYDLIKSGSSMAARQMNSNKSTGGNSSDNSQKDSPSFQLPEKESLPLGLGTGQVSGSVVRGLTRLLTVDAERECACEAAALYAAYMLGLPCFSFRPNALEASVLVVESTKDDDDNSGSASLLSGTGIMRVLVWLMAPVAMESMKHAQLIVSDPREAEGFLLRLEDYAKNTNEAVTQEDLWWVDDAQERADLLKWAFTEADLLLRDNKAVVNEISNRLTGGAATIGDCVATMERW